MADFISVDRSKNLGVALLQAATDARHFGQEVAALSAIMAAMDSATIETQFGLPAGKGADLQFLVNTLKTGLDGLAQFGLLPNWLGQV